MSYISTELTKAGFIAIGSACADIDGQREEAMLSFYNAVVVDGDVSYDAWVDGTDCWKAGYAEAKGCKPDDNKVSVALTSFTNALKLTYDIVKPAKPTKGGQAKADQRSKKAEELEAIKAKPMEELVAEVAMLTASPTLANIKKAGLIQKAVEDKRKEAMQDRMDSIKALQKEAKEMITNCLEERKLNGVIAILNDYDFEISGL